MAINTPSPNRSATGSAGGTAGGMTQQLGNLVQAIETLTIAQTKSLTEQQAIQARLLECH